MSCTVSVIYEFQSLNANLKSTQVRFEKLSTFVYPNVEILLHRAGAAINSSIHTTRKLHALFDKKRSRECSMPASV